MFGVNSVFFMIMKWADSIKHDENFGVLLFDLSKTFECLPSDLMIAQLHAYGIDLQI